MLIQADFGLLSRDSVKTIRKGLEGGVMSGYGLCAVAAGFSLEHAVHKSWFIAMGAAACAYKGGVLASGTRVAKQALEPLLIIEQGNVTSQDRTKVLETEKVPN